MVVKAAALKAASKILTMAFWKGKSKVDLKVENRTDLKGLQMADAEAVAWTVFSFGCSEGFEDGVSCGCVEGRLDGFDDGFLDGTIEG